MENLKKGDMLYLQDISYGTPRLLRYTIEKITPKQYVLNNGRKIRQEDLREIGANRQYVIQPDESFLARVEVIRAKIRAKDVLDTLKNLIVEGDTLTEGQYRYITDTITDLRKLHEL